jgi:putative flippase GtrA
MKGYAGLAARYAAFAAVATAANLASQAVVISLYDGPFDIEASILVGTAVGLPVKYLLDKRWIFEFTTANLAHDGRLLSIYALTGMLTTLIFWSVEYAFHWLFWSDYIRYVGGALGLTVGYLVKYRLDRRFVFVQ